MARCRWCRQIFVSSRAASVQEGRCRLGKELSPPLSVGNVGGSLHNTLAEQSGWLMSNTWVDSAVGNLTCRQCGEIFVHVNARRLYERFCAKICPEADGVVYWACLCGFEVRLPPNASRRDRATAQLKQYVHNKNCRGGGGEQLKCVRCNKLSPQFGPERPMKARVGFVGGVTRCFVHRPIELAMSRLALNGLLRLQC